MHSHPSLTQTSFVSSVGHLRRRSSLARIRKVLCRPLLKAGHTVVEACDGIEALEKFDEALSERLPFSAVFMDYVMPNMDGKATCSAFVSERGI